MRPLRGCLGTRRPLRGRLGTGRPLRGLGAAAARFPAGKDRPLLPPSAAGAEKGKIFPSLFPCVSPVSPVLSGDDLGFGTGCIVARGLSLFTRPVPPSPGFMGSFTDVGCSRCRTWKTCLEAFSAPFFPGEQLQQWPTHPR